MRLVIDASVALKWFVAEEGTDAAEAVAARHELTAPELVVAEVCNGLWKIERLGRLPPEDAAEAVASVAGYFDRLFMITPLAPRAAAIARELGHPVYDCFYLALAEAQDVPLVTADRRLTGRVAGTPFAARLRHLADVADQIGDA